MLQRKKPLARVGFKRRTQKNRLPVSADYKPGPKKRSSYARRQRHVDFMLWVKSLPCCVPIMVGKLHGPTLLQMQALLLAHPCSGPIEADHSSEGRGLGTKAHDGTCIPLCRQHHRERTDHAGFFRMATRDSMRAFCAGARAWVGVQAEGHGIVVPTAPDTHG